MQSFAPSRFGAYQLTAHLGRGGMANVYLARRAGAAGFERLMVVKRILSDHHTDPHFVQMFVNEAKIAAKLNHPNIVNIYELGEIDGEFFMAMEYVQGKDLLRLLRRLAKREPSAPWVPADAAAYIARELCRGLAHAHEYSENGRPSPIVHRDVSPQNIMLAYDGQVKLVDFGIAKATDSLAEDTRTGALKGKFAYMAPEQIDGLVPGPQTDIFALGIVMHEMLTGRRLFKGPTEFETMTRVRTMVVPPPSSITTGVVPPALDAIVLKALARDRNLRYARAADMAQELDAFLASRFSMEKMALYMGAIYPVEERTVDPTLTPAGGTVARPRRPSEEADNDAEASPSPSARSLSSEAALAVQRERSDEAAALTPPATPAARATTPAAALATPPTGPVVPLQSGDTDPVTPRGAKVVASRRAQRATATRTALRILLFVLLGASGLTIAWTVQRPPEPEPDPLAAGEDPLAEPSPSAATAAAVAPLQVRTEPPGATVYDGPKLVGTTPLELQHRDGAVLTFELSGFEALRYTVQPEDGPTLTLRLHSTAPLRAIEAHPASRPTPHAAGAALPARGGVAPATAGKTGAPGAAAGKSGAAPPRAGGHKPNVAVFDDDRPQPKVETIDD